MDAIPYCGPAPVPGDWLMQWNFDPPLLAALAIGAVFLMRRAAAPPAWAAYGLLVLLFVSPLCALSSALFSARVGHHLLLTTVAPPLFVWGLRAWAPPGGVTLWAPIHALVFWLWHAPAPYAAALSSDVLYWAMQASLFATALGFWAGLRATAAPLMVGVSLVMMVQMGLLGALITFAGVPLYSPHYLVTVPWGLTALEDQQLAGLVMWVPGAGIFLAAALAGINGWLADRRPAA